MTARNLDALFDPQSIALIGASNQAGSVGWVIARNLLGGGFDKPIFLVNPHATSIQGVKSYSSVRDLPGRADLAIVATPPAAAPGIVADLGENGCRAVIVITAGLDDAQRTAMFAAARPRTMRIVGPNCLGLLSGAKGVNASFAHVSAAAGDIAFITQSGAIATTILDWAQTQGVGFSHILSLGDMSDVDFGDVLDYLALDRHTRSILLYVESITSARKFMSAARIAARAKPVIVVKSGRSEAGARAAASHTGALAGADLVYDAAFRRAGMLRVDTLRDLFGAAETLASGLRPHNDRLIILTNGGGLGVMAADALEAQGGRLGDLSAATTAGLDAILPKTWSRANPVDIIGDANGERYTAALNVLSTEECDGLLVINCPTGVADSADAAQAVIGLKRRLPDLPLLACWAGGPSAQRAGAAFSGAGIANHETPHEAVQAFMQLVEYAHNQEALLQAPSANQDRPASARQDARQVVSAVLSEGRSLLTEPEAKQLLAAYGIPVVATYTARTPAECAALAAKIGAPAALKILSRQITHKSDVGGVALGLQNADAVQAEAEAMLDRVRAAAPDARIDGFSVQEMVVRPGAQELLVGANVDPTFGPVLLFGHGGVATEIVADRVIGLPPLNSILARDMISRTRVAKLLHGYRHRPAADMAAIERVLVALADLVADVPEIAELDINPLLADEKGVIALDARVVVRSAAGDGPSRLAIRPYPSELIEDWTLSDGSAFQVRPIRASDVNAMLAMVRQTKPEDLRLRFHRGMRDLAPDTAARLSQIDYDREMAFVAVEAKGAIGAIARLIFDPDFESAEYALIVRSDLHGRGLGRRLLSELLSFAQAKGAKRVWGDVLAENANMLTMASAMGATCASPVDGVRRTEFRVDRPRS